MNNHLEVHAHLKVRPDERADDESATTDDTAAVFLIGCLTLG